MYISLSRDLTYWLEFSEQMSRIVEQSLALSSYGIFVHASADLTIMN